MTLLMVSVDLNFDCFKATHDVHNNLFNWPCSGPFSHMELTHRHIHAVLLFKEIPKYFNLPSTK